MQFVCFFKNSLKQEKTGLMLNDMRKRQDRLFEEVESLKRELDAVTMQQAKKADFLQSTAVSVDTVERQVGELETKVNEIEYQLLADSISKNIKTALTDFQG